jgi:putative membrane protein
MKRSLAIAVALAVGLGSLAGGASADDAKKSPQDAKMDLKFVQGAASGGLLEVKSSELALKKSTSPDVKKFAQRMIDDHTKAHKELLAVVKRKGMEPPKDLMPLHQALLDRLTKAGAGDFDKEFWTSQLAAHEEAVALFEAEAKAGQDVDLKAFATKTLPTLKEHLRMVQDMAKGGTRGVGG